MIVHQKDMKIVLDKCTGTQLKNHVDLINLCPGI
jgi:hypothetical protein